MAEPGGTAEGRLVVPRTLLRTHMVDRGVVRIEDGHVSVATAKPARAAPEATRSSGNISEEEFLDKMRNLNPALPDQIKSFLEQLSPLRVYGEYRRALNLKWDAPDGRTVNLGIIQTKWQVRLGGKTPRITEIASRLDAWVEVLRSQLPQLAAQTEED